MSRQDQTAAIGVLGEDFVVCWLQQQDWTILHRRWHCRWGELDIIAQHKPLAVASTGGEDGLSQVNFPSPMPSTIAPMPYLVFVEVKTRSHKNWDLNGRLAIAPSKQTKLWQAAELFLAAHPQLADFPCRFDVALVSYKRLSSNCCPNGAENKIFPAMSKAGALDIAGYHFVLHDYIQSAFEL